MNIFLNYVILLILNHLIYLVTFKLKVDYWVQFELTSDLIDRSMESRHTDKNTKKHCM